MFLKKLFTSFLLAALLGLSLHVHAEKHKDLHSSHEQCSVCSVQSRLVLISDSVAVGLFFVAVSLEVIVLRPEPFKYFYPAFSAQVRAPPSL